jgi:dynein heavy chain
MLKGYIAKTIGELFIESPPFNLNDAFDDSTSTTPIIFVLSPGADPMAYLLTLAEEREFKDKFKYLSLG